MTAANGSGLARLTQAYDALDPKSREIVDLLSVLVMPVTAPILRLCLMELSPPALGKSEWTDKAIDSLVGGLVGSGLAEEVERKKRRCPPAFREIPIRRMAWEGSLERFAAAARRTLERNEPWHERREYAYERSLREFRIDLYLQRWDLASQHLAVCRDLGPPGEDPIVEVLANPFDPEILSGLPAGAVESFLVEELSLPVQSLEPIDAKVLAYAEDLWKRMGRKTPLAVRGYLAEQKILRGHLDEAVALVDAANDEGGGVASLHGLIAFLRGDNAAAIGHFEAGMKLVRSATRKRKIFLAEFPGLFFLFALLRSGDRGRIQEARIHVEAALNTRVRYLSRGYEALLEVIAVLLAEVPTASALSRLRPRSGNLQDALDYWDDEALVRPPSGPETPTINTLIRALALYWLAGSEDDAYTDILRSICQKAHAAGYRLIEAEAAALLGVRGSVPHAERAAVLYREIGTTPVHMVLTREEPWERTLAAVLDLFESGEAAKSAAPPNAVRLVWLLSWQGDECLLRPVEQRRIARGGWSVGKNVALSRLHAEAGRMDFLTPQDLRACGAIRKHGGHHRWDREYLAFDNDILLPALVGHPCVFLDGVRETRVEIVRGELELAVVTGKRGAMLALSPEIDGPAAIKVVREGPTRIRIYELGSRGVKLAALLGRGMRFPTAGAEKVRRVLAAAASTMTVRSDGDETLATVAEIPADATPRMQLVPAGHGLRAEILVRPFGNGGPYYSPGAGGRSVIAEVEGRKVGTRRDLDGERRVAEEVTAACPALSRGESDGASWTLTDPESCLELLDEIHSLGERIVVEWPQGESIKPPHRVSLDGLRLDFRRDREWFSAKGELRVDDSLVVDLRRLLDLSAATPSRFLPLGEGRFLALTQTFRKRLDELRLLGEFSGKHLRFHPLVAPALEELAGEVGSFRTDRAWKELVERFREAAALEPDVPTTLQAELRPYQIEGYRWLARLAHCGVGACLADDMGLGKTLQALALILTRAREGACLVVAPTSVCPNWADEAARFAPTLNVIPFGPGDRGKTIEDLKPFDLLVTSYGLLLQETERLAAVPWKVMVLDEAQAIKNVGAKRSQAAMELRADFKIITTGTPIENHLGELWNLFRFLNPGLLGSLESFNRRFAVPIERDGDRAARARLKRLIQPFLLRRIKSQVLEDLPPRTEILHRVQFGPEEMALYEALRNRALERLESFQGPPTAKRFQILAEIMRLRRACCNPRLVLPDSRIPSAKLEGFAEIVDELRENRHRALVFSQFVDHLTLVRAWLDEQGISYQYLDGSTPMQERKARVDAFQAGEHDLFLISLKAGGLGLNLTGADYVIHLDPWWNPAVEDQASDRAHRIGQQRPVTVYRLVAAGTIEEKIVDLHRHKRDLADNLLEDSDSGGRLAVDDLIAVLRER
jgi:superfamily II DNA or RNA helicase